MAFDVEALRRAQQLCSPQGQANIGKIDTKGRGSINFDAAPETLLSEAQLYEQGVDMRQMNPNYTERRGPENSRLPDVIKQSFMETDIDTSCLDPEYAERKRYDDMMSRMMEQVGQARPQRQAITENRYNVETQAPSYGGGAVDYNIIRQIVEEAIDRKLKTLNENTLKAISLKNGNIALQDHAGNIFSAKLEFKGNSSKKK